MVHSIKDLIVALICVAMLNVAAANAQTATAQDLPVTGGKLTSTQTSFQQPGSTSLSVEQSPLKLGSTSTEADQVPAHIQEMPEFKTTVVYLGTLPLLSVSGGESAPLERASIISSKVNQLQWDHTPGSDIRVRFDGKHYAIVAGKDQELLTIDQGVRISTRYPGSFRKSDGAADRQSPAPPLRQCPGTG